MKKVKFQGWDCVQLATPHIELIVSVSVGPRIVSFAFPENSNVLAELPELVVPTDLGSYNFRGGHRLWHSPERMPLSYVPDDDPVDVRETPEGLEFSQLVEEQTGVQKKLVLRLESAGPSLTIDHVLTNLGKSPVELAPWAITMFPLGGVAVLPVSAKSSDDLQPSQHLAIWPYSRLNDPRLHFVDSALVIQGRAGDRCKLGFSNRVGWMAYWQPGTIFIKQANFLPDRTYPDLNSSSEFFINGRFLELETLGPLEEIQPGESITHRERWSLLDAPHKLSLDEKSITQLTGQIERELFRESG